MVFALAFPTVTHLDYVTRRAEWFTWLALLIATLINCRHEALKCKSLNETIEHLQGKRRAERVMSHHIKNVLAEAMATLFLFLDSQSPVASASRV